MFLGIGKLISRGDEDLQRLMRTEFPRDYQALRKMNNGHVDARSFLQEAMGLPRKR